MISVNNMDLSVEIAEAKNIDLEQIFALRYKIFTEKLGWLKPNAQKKDTDRYDARAIHFIAYASGKIVGYVRVIEGNSLSDFMLGHEFKSLVPPDVEDKINRSQKYIELTRLFITDNKSISSKSILFALYKSVAKWASNKKRFHWLFIADSKNIAFYQKNNFVMEVLSSGFIGADKTIYYLAELDLLKTAKVLKKSSPEMYQLLLA